MANRKIIVVDDEPDFVENVRSFFELHEYECLVAFNGREGLEKIEKERPSLIILDILMPNMDGYTMLRELKKRKIKILCIILTAKEKLKDLFELEKVDRFVTKPFELKKLKEIVDEMLENSDDTPYEEKKPDKTPKKEGKKVLLIEDEARLADSIKNFLQIKNYSVHVAYTGDEGLKAVKTFKPDIIISDILMPQMDGYSMIKELRKEGLEVPIIITTAKEKMKDLFEVEGVDAFMAKPFGLNDLERKIQEIIAKRS